MQLDNLWRYRRKLKEQKLCQNGYAYQQPGMYVYLSRMILGDGFDVLSFILHLVLLFLSISLPWDSALSGDRG